MPAAVRQCDVYITVIGFRYGSVVPGQGVSYTEMEFDEATMAGLPRLAFLLSGTADVPTGLADTDRCAVERFRRKVLDAGLVVREFSTAGGLELEVFHALRDLPGRPSAVPAAGAVTFSLPPDTAAFAGRGEALSQITAAVTSAAAAGGVVAVRAIGGMPGAGKTTLAVHAAHLLREKFPDRQLFLTGPPPAGQATEFELA